MKKTVKESLLELGKDCGAIYVVPRDQQGRRKGPLVAYAGTDNQGRNLIGDIYFNFARIEPYPNIVSIFASAAYNKLREQDLIDSFDTVVGIPDGGRTFAHAFAHISGKRYTYAGKDPIPTEAGKKQEYVWNLSRFEFRPGERVALVEDVFNNFQNTDNTLLKVSETGAEVVLLIGALNRSPIYDDFYAPNKGPFAGHEFPIAASIREAYPEYEQDDPQIVDDVKDLGIEFAVKKNWARLYAYMQS